MQLSLANSFTWLLVYFLARLFSYLLAYLPAWNHLRVSTVVFLAHFVAETEVIIRDFRLLLIFEKPLGRVKLYQLNSKLVRKYTDINPKTTKKQSLNNSKQAVSW